MANVHITDDVMEVLRRGRIEGEAFFLPQVQLERKLYEAVNKVLVNAGGKWSRTARAHVFPSDPSAKLGLAMKSGKSIDEKKLFQAFFTPPELAARLVRKIGPTTAGMKVLEPSAGEGALVKAIFDSATGEDCYRVLAVEIDGEKVAKLTEFRNRLLYANESNFTILHEDFLRMMPPSSGTFHAVVMNPPFSKGQDVKHVEHALKFLKPGGRFAAIMCGNTERPAFQRLVQATNAEVEDVEAGAFSESGTDVRTVIVHGAA